MQLIFVIASLFFHAWGHEQIGNGNSGMQGITVGYGQNDDTLRIYSGCDDSVVYEFTFSGSSWRKNPVGKGQGQMHGLSVGFGRNDAIRRIYAGSWTTSAGPDEFTYEDGSWQQVPISSGLQNSYDGVVAYGRNDDTLRVYTGTNEGQCHEFTWRNGAWTSQYMGGSSSSTDGSQHDVFAGHGRNDDTIRIYGACTDGNVWEFTNRGGVWFPQVISTTDGCAWGVCVAEGRNDGVKRVYASCGPQGSPGDIYEFTWENDNWTRTLVMHSTSCFFGIGAGVGRNDDTLRLYAGSFSPGHLYEYTWRNNQWNAFDCGEIPSGSWLHDIYLAKGRNDDTVRVYAGGGDRWVHEFTYRPDAGVRVQPDSSAETNPGVPIVYSMWVVNTGTHKDTIDIATSGTLDGWDIRILDSGGTPLTDSDEDGKPDVGAMNSFDSVSIRVEITSPSAAIAGTTDSTRVWGSSSLAPLVRDSAILLTTIAQISGLVVEPDQTDSIIAGEAVDYILTVRNESNSSDLVDLTSSGTISGWGLELLDDAGLPLEDSDSDGDADIGPLSAGEDVEIIARITSPPGAEGGTVDTSRVIGALNIDQSVRDAAALMTVIRIVPQVRIERDSTDSTDAGSPVRYRVNVTNLGNKTEAINLAFHSSQNWQCFLYDSTGITYLSDSDGDSHIDAGSLGAYGDSALLWIDIAPPANARHNTVDTTYLTAFSSLDELVRDSIRLITRAMNLIPGVSVEPDQEGTVDAGSSILYTLRIINQGNEPDSFDLRMESDLSWQAALRLPQGEPVTTTGPLVAKDTMIVDVQITSPPELASIIGSPDSRNTEHRTLWAQSLSNPSVQDSAYIITLAVPPLDIHNYPNPFRGATTFIYSIPTRGKATLSIFNRAGEHIATLFESIDREPGIFTESWNGLSSSNGRTAPGVYLYSLTFVPEQGKTRRITKKALLQP